MLNDISAADVEHFSKPLPRTEDVIELVDSVLESSLDFYLMFIEISDLIDSIGMSDLWLELDEDLNLRVLTLSF